MREQELRSASEISRLAARSRAMASLMSVHRVVSAGPVQQVRSYSAVLGKRMAAWARSAFLIRLFLLMVGFCPTLPAAAPDPYTSEHERSPPQPMYYVRARNQRLANEQQLRFRKQVAIGEAVGSIAEPAVTEEPASVETPTQSLTGAAGLTHQLIWFILASATAVIVVIRRLRPELFANVTQRLNPLSQAPMEGAKFTSRVRAEEESFSEFLPTFQINPARARSVEQQVAVSVPECDPVGEFFGQWPMRLVTLRKLLQNIGHTSDVAVRHGFLAELRDNMRTLKDEACHPELLLAGQMASVLVGLLKQLTNKATDVTPSTLRTVASGVELLESLCKPGLNSDLVNNPPLRFLVVDDDAISRMAVSFALTRAFEAPDLAEHGEGALVLANQHAYDVIFLDVQMPRMDGFELCLRIHDTVLNTTTPVVFVTCRSDFEARAQATLSGGNDLIGKPFLTFEITVKALTLALQGRLERRARAAGIGNSSEALVTAPENPSLAHQPKGDLGQATTEAASTDVPTNDPQPSPSPSGKDETAAAPLETKPAVPVQRRLVRLPALTKPDDSKATSDSSPAETAEVFGALAAAHFEPMREYIHATFQMADESARQKTLLEFYLHLKALGTKMNGWKDHPAPRVNAALEGLLTKLILDAKHCTSSTLQTVATGVDLLTDLCATRAKANLMTDPPIRMLVVDDDPISRRIMAGALQTAFEKPDSADSGEAALALAMKKTFDVVFMDVLMSGMDGFAACQKIHETTLNRTTPVVFVTSLSDFEARSRSTFSGGSELIGKPFLTAEITVKALTYALRGRLQKIEMATHITQFQSHDEPEARVCVEAPSTAA